MKWGRKKHVPSSSLSRAHLVSWFSKLSCSSDLKPAKEKKQDDEASQKMSTESPLSSTKRQIDIHDWSSKRLQRVSLEKGNDATRPADMESDEKFEEIRSRVRQKAREFQRERRGFLEVEAMDRDKGTVIRTPRNQVNRDKKRCERRDQKLLEQKPQDAELKAKKPARRACKGGYSREEFVNLKAGQERKSMYQRREVGTKENSKVRVFSPRACRVKAIENFKKAKLRAGEHYGGEVEKESFAVVKCSSDPQKDFRDSMVEMIMENGIINHPEELKELLVCYLRLNTDGYHNMIINVFQQVHSDLNLH